jgi:hypothetical protein
MRSNWKYIICFCIWLAIIGVGVFLIVKTKPFVSECQQFKDQRRYDCFIDSSALALFSLGICIIFVAGESFVGFIFSAYHNAVFGERRARREQVRQRISGGGKESTEMYCTNCVPNKACCFLIAKPILLIAKPIAFFIHVASVFAFVYSITQMPVCEEKEDGCVQRGRNTGIMVVGLFGWGFSGSCLLFGKCLPFP